MPLFTRLFGLNRTSHYNKGIALYNRGDYEAAVAELTLAVQEAGSDKNPYHGLGRFYAAEARTHLGLAFLRAGDAERAEGEFAQAVAQNPGYPDRHYYLGIARERRGELAGAAESFRAALALNADYRDARASLALVLAEQGEEEDARAELAAVAARGFPLPPELAAEGAPFTPAALAALRTQLDESSKCTGHVETAVERYQRGDLAGAAEELEQAAALKPRYADLHCRLGVVVLEMGRHEEALAALDRALALNPSYGDAHLYRGRTLLTLGRPAEAAVSLSRASEVYPETPVVMGLLATAWARSGRTWKAADLARAALAIDAQCPEARDALVLSHLLEGRAAEAGELLPQAPAVERARFLLDAGQPREAMRMLEQAAGHGGSADTETAESQLLFGLALERAGYEEAARAQFERASLKDPSWWPPRLALARAHLARGECQRALGALDRELDAGTDHPDILTVAGECHRRLDRLETSVELFTRALEAAPGTVPALVGRALACRALGRDQEAEDDLKTALRRDPLHLVARRLLTGDPDGEDVARAA